MEIRYSRHLVERQRLRNLPQGLAEEVFLHADSYFFDSLTKTLVAVKRLPLFNIDRDVSLVYRRADAQSVIFITIHPLKEGQKERRVQSGRWTPYEPESAL
jgi:hypothetical protein